MDVLILSILLALFLGAIAFLPQEVIQVGLMMLWGLMFIGTIAGIILAII